MTPSARHSFFKASIVLLLGGAIAAIFLTPLRSYLTLENVRAVIAQLRGVWYGPLVFVVLYAVGAVLIVPASIFVLSAGVIWGWKLGGLYSLVAGTIGAAASFFVARYVGSGMLARFGVAGEKVRRQVDHAGFKSLLIMRLVPVFPFALLNYGSGVAGVKFGDFILATFLGLAPSAFVFAWSADALVNGTLTREDAFKRILLVGVLLAILVLVPTIIRKIRGPGVGDV